MSKKLVIIQSNYIPWKGYFDLIASADEVMLYDDMQFTKNDWRNRNYIKTPRGPQWLSIPVGQNISRRIRDVELPDDGWQERHWQTLAQNYRTAPHFKTVAALLEPLYRGPRFTHLSPLNRAFIEAICGYLGVTTKITNSWDYTMIEGKTERLADLCVQAGASDYISGPAAREYIDPAAFEARGVRLHWFDYGGYMEYPQLWGEFVHAVSIVDLLFNCGAEAPRYMKFGAV